KFRDFNLIRRFSDLLLGFQLTPKRAKKLIISNKITPNKKELLLKVLINYEAAFAFN
ncbi:hypothetical protein L207DRAFT_446721, partial [Hyaloscypha variabilis F]